MNVNIDQLLTEAGVINKQTIYLLSLHSRKFMENEGELIVSEKTPFGIRAAYLNKLARHTAMNDYEDFDPSVDVEEFKELKREIDSHLGRVSPANDEWKAIDPACEFEMVAYGDSVVLFASQPFNVVAWKKAGYSFA